MNVHFETFFNNYQTQMSDTEFYKMELALCDLAEPLGFDTLFCVEHHFSDYSMAPDSTQFLAYMAARTERIKLGTLGVILPWSDPLRVAERLILLDHLSDGRAVFGMARGLAKREYRAFRVDMEESRERFDESARMVCEALESGVIQGSGTFYPQPSTPLRPAPRGSFDGRKFMVAMSPDTIPICAETGAVQSMFAYKPWEEVVPDIEGYRKRFQQHHGRPAPPTMTADLMYCAASEDEAEEGAYNYVAKYFDSFTEHYEMFGEHLANSKSYSHYSGAGATLKELGHEAMKKAFVASNVWGTPQQILAKYEERKRIIGDFQACAICSFSGMSYEVASESIRLFATEVMPELRRWG